MINSVSLTGRLVKNPDLRYSAAGVAVATFTLAVNRNFKDANGNREADFINCVIWRKSAETLANYAKKGTLIGVTGRMQTRSYNNQQGNRVYVTEVVAETFSLLESRSKSDTGISNNQSTNYQGNNQNSSQSFSQGQNDPFGNSSSIDIDDLPF